MCTLRTYVREHHILTFSLFRLLTEDTRTQFFIYKLIPYSDQTSESDKSTSSGACDASIL